VRFRTTLALDEDVYRAARSLAQANGRSIGSVLSELARTALRPPAPARHGKKGAFPTFAVGKDAPPLTSEMVRAALSDDES
jgi:hypothetical protein